MKSRFWVLGIVFVFLGLMILSPHGSVGQTAPAANIKGPLIMWDPDERSWDPVSKQQLLTIVKGLQTQLDAIPSGSLTPAVISQIADVYGDNGNLTGYDGWTLRGKREISLYFMRLLDCHKTTDFKMEIKFVYVKEFTNTFKTAKGSPQAIVHSVYLVLSNSFMLDGQQVKVPGSTNCPHQADCTCKHNN